MWRKIRLGDEQPLGTRTRLSEILVSFTKELPRTLKCIDEATNNINHWRGSTLIYLARVKRGFDCWAGSLLGELLSRNERSMTGEDHAGRVRHLQ